MPASSAEAKPGAGPRVLVAEDNVVNQRLAVAMLARLGYQADVVGNGAEAVEALGRTGYEAVLMDCEMPVMDGYQATAEIRSNEEGAARTPIIAMTAAALKGDRERCVAAGMDDYISKPVHMKELETTLRKWVGDGRSNPEASGPIVDAAASDTSLRPGRVAELRALGRDEGPSVFSELAEIFLRDTPPRLGSLRGAALRGDAGATEETAHYLRGAAANIGEARMAALYGELETLGRSGDLAGAMDLLDQLDAEFGRIREALRVELGRGES